MDDPLGVGMLHRLADLDAKLQPLGRSASTHSPAICGKATSGRISTKKRTSFVEAATTAGMSSRVSNVFQQVPPHRRELRAADLRSMSDRCSSKNGDGKFSRRNPRDQKYSGDDASQAFGSTPVGPRPESTLATKPPRHSSGPWTLRRQSHRPCAKGDPSQHRQSPPGDHQNESA